MPDVSNLKIGQNSYALKDSTARTQAGTASATANNALSIANTAKTTAENAQSTAGSALSKANDTEDKLDNTTLIGTYTSETETLEYSLQIGVGG